MLAANGNLINFQGAAKITTPTFSINRNTNQALTINTVTPLQFTAEDWDNNNFWLSSDNTKVYFKSAGLYLLGYSALFNANVNVFRANSIRINGSGGKEIAHAQRPTGATSGVYNPGSAIWYFNANDYIQLLFFTAGNGDQAQCPQLWGVAITPEAII